MTPKQRMLNAYWGLPNDRPAVAPEFWYYYPARVLGVDMIQFEREIPLYRALKTTFTRFGCEGWGIVGPILPSPTVTSSTTERWVDADTLEVRVTTHTPKGELTHALRYHRREPSWVVERGLKDLGRDLPAWELATFGAEPETAEVSAMTAAWHEVGDTYLLEAAVGGTFFDLWGGAREGGFETALEDFMTPQLTPLLERLQARHIERLVRLTRVICERTPFESLFMGCTWSCLSLLSPALWRRWDKPVIRAVAAEAHRHGRLLHLHFHGRCREVVPDFAELGVDCVCPFERPPGGDIAGLDGLRTVARQLHGRTTMNGNVHTVETLLRGRPADVRREVAEILEAFRDNPRVIVGTGDQVAADTPEENLHAMLAAVDQQGV